MNRPNLPVTITDADYRRCRPNKLGREVEAYCPLAAALSRTYPDLFTPWNVGSVVAPIKARPTEEEEDATGWYRIPEEAREAVIAPYDRGHFDPEILPYTLTLTWESSVELS